MIEAAYGGLNDGTYELPEGCGSQIVSIFGECVKHTTILIFVGLVIATIIASIIIYQQSKKNHKDQVINDRLSHINGTILPMLSYKKGGIPTIGTPLKCLQK